MIEVFKTNITDHEAAQAIALQLMRSFPHLSASFDLEDCDNVLRLKGDAIRIADIISFVASRGFMCEVLE